MPIEDILFTLGHHILDKQILEIWDKYIYRSMGFQSINKE